MNGAALPRIARTGLVLCLLVGVGCTKKSANGDVDLPPPPATVDDLRASTVAPDWVELTWTAPVDDDEHGPVSSYDIRYTNFEPNPGDWDNATRVTWNKNPVPGGFTETMQVTGLTSGGTYYFALRCCDNNDQCSPISNMVEVTLPLEFEVSFPDAVLEAAIRNKLNQPSGPIMYSAVLGIVDLAIEGGGVTDLTGLEFCENLQVIFFLGNHVSDLEPISELQNLRVLNLNSNDVDDISLLAGIHTLEQLDIGFNPLSDISPLASLTNITFLSAHDIPIVDITALASLTNLHIVDLTVDRIVDISPLVSNTGLGDSDEVYLTGNPLSETSINTHIPALEARGVTVKF